MKKLFTILILLGVTAFGQIEISEGLNMPGAYNGWVNPPSINALGGVQKSGGTLLVITTGTRRYKTTIKVAASGGDITEGTYAWKFSSGPTSNYWQNSWGNVNVSFNSLQNYTKESPNNNSVTVTNGKWYTVNWKDIGYVNTTAIWMETTGEPVTITNVQTEDPLPGAGDPVEVSITTSAAPATDEFIYVRYTTNNWANSSFVQASGTGTSWTATIPGSGNGGNSQSWYYVLTSTVPLGSLTHADADMQTINFTNNSGLNYPLPVELTSFNAAIRNGLVDLKWETATEVNNYGFEVERKTASADWSKIGFVEGHGSTNSPKYYSYSDKPEGTGKIAYRLKQIDNDGQFEYSPEVEVLVDNLPNGFVLEQNYPNPFNPETSIRFALKEDTKATLKVYNSLGAEIATLFDGTAEAGRYYDVKFGGSELASGFYIYKLVAGEYVSVKKMLLMK
jgi:hypothetical protein